MTTSRMDSWDTGGQQGPRLNGLVDRLEMEISGRWGRAGSIKQTRFPEDQVFAILKEADSGGSEQEICRRPGISPATYYQ